MQEILQNTLKERALYFQQASARSVNIKSPIIMEKDFWVCWTLQKIFSHPDLSPHVIFKGGTSLSKCYNIIQRFSEDIDLTLSKKYIGITEENDPTLASTSSQRSKRLNLLTEKVKEKIANKVKPLLINILERYLPSDSKWRLETDEADEQSLIFHYPSCLDNQFDGYIQTSIKLEFGARGDNSPCESKIVLPYIQQTLPEVISDSESIIVTTLLAKRTFWEKATLLHAEYHRNPQKSLPSRIFRHYYDMVMLDKNNITQEALLDISLLNDVVRNKVIYFPSKWANYDAAKIGTLRLYPNDDFIKQLKQDYKKMTEMFFGEAPDFNEILAKIKNIESVVNEL